MVVGVVAVTGAIAVSCSGERRRRASVALVGKSNGGEDPGVFVRSWVVSSSAGACTWVTEIWIIGVTDFGKSLVAINAETRNQGYFATAKGRVPQRLMQDVLRLFEELQQAASCRCQISPGRRPAGEQAQK